MDRLFAGEKQDVLGKRWDIHLDISAPQIFLPDSFTASAAAVRKNYAKSDASPDTNNSTNNVVVLDLGRLKLDSYSPNIVEKKTATNATAAVSEDKAKETTSTLPAGDKQESADDDDDDEDDEEDDFLTPMSTPPRSPPILEDLQELPTSPTTTTTTATTTAFMSPVEGTAVMQSALTSPPSAPARPNDKEALTDDALRERIYDRYILQLSQVPF